MARIVHPPQGAHPDLRQKMTAGEQAVFEGFQKTLPLEWEIYIQPHLNGLRPDFVLLNPNVGIAVFEVKDWNLDALCYFARKDENKKLILMGRRDGKEFSLEKQNPFRKVEQYKEEIFNLYCPRLQQKSGWGAISAGVIFPFADADRVKKLRSDLHLSKDTDAFRHYSPVSGRAELAAGNIEAVFPEMARTRSNLMTPALAADLRGWLVEPDFAVTQRQPLELDRNQSTLSQTRTVSGYRRIKGPAGSGKSLVLAARAARLMNEGKSVLIATYNITLWHYLRDIVVRGVDHPDRMKNVVFTHFHKWCKDICHEAGMDEAYDELFKEVHETEARKGISDEEKRKRLRPLLNRILNLDVPELANLATDQPDVTRYDAILIDEGQDYRLPWWNALRKVCKPDGEMLLVADATQDVYGTARAWTEEAMPGAGFVGGRWAQLDVSYRLPPAALDLARDFAARYLPDETRDLPRPEQGMLDLYPCQLRWVQCAPEDARKQCVDAILAMMRETGKAKLANADITFLTKDIAFGRQVTDSLESYRVWTVHTFDKNTREQRRRKMAFYMGDARIKATTLHSFKGWEARLLVVHVDQADGDENLALVYAGLTRLKRRPEGSWLTVVCSAPELAEYGQAWAPEPSILDPGRRSSRPSAAPHRTRKVRASTHPTI